MGGSSKKQTIAYKQILGMDLHFSLGPIDKLVKILFGEDKRVGWTGEQSENGEIIVSEPNLFGGDKKEGGVSGAVDVEFGASTQGRNAYLQSQLGNDIPAYRGLFRLIFKKFYFGTNPYLKKVAVLAQRIHVRQDGITQWYDNKSEIATTEEESDITITESFSGDLSDYTNNAPSNIFIDGGVLHCDDSGNLVQSAGLVRSITPTVFDFGEVRFRKISDGIGDQPNVSVNNLFSFGPQREQNVDSAQRARVQGNNFFGSSKLLNNNWYRLEATRNGTDIDYVIYDEDGGNSVVDTITLPASTDPSDTITFGNGTDGSSFSGGMAVEYDDLFLSSSVLIPTGDINPAHFIREALTDPDWGRGLPEADMGDSFTTAADVFFAEGMGVSLRWDRQKSIEEFMEILLSHCDAALYEDRKTGKFELKPIRFDYDPDLLDVLDKSVISKIDKPNWRVFGELPTAVTVVYTDPDNGKDASVTHSNPALAALQGKEKETTLQYPGFRRADLAARVAARESRALGSEIFTADLIGDRTLLDYNAGDVFKLNWPEYGISNMIVRVTQGTKVEGRNKIRLPVSTDVYAIPTIAPVATPTDEWEDPSQPPAATTNHIAVEAPYYELVQRNGEAATEAILAENQDLGYILATAARPQFAINASLFVDSGAGYEDSGSVDFCPYAQLAANVGPTDTIWQITGGIDLDQVRIGSHAQVNGELVRIDAISVGEDQLTVGRGVLDTVPAPLHASGSSILLWDDFAEGDGTEYVVSESIDVKVVPQSGAGVSDLADITEDTVLMNTRAFRPYPPGNLLIDSSAYPSEVAAGTFTATVAHRDRTQQTSGTLQDTTAGNIGPEVGVTYTWELFRTDTEAVLQSFSGDSATSKAFAPGYSGQVRLEVKSMRDGEDSWQSLTHTFQLGSIFNLTTEAGDNLTTEAGDNWMTE